MMKYPRSYQYQKGFLSIIAIILIVVISVICVAATYQFVSDSRQAANSLSSSQAFYMAQSGLEYNKHLIRNGTLSCGTDIGSTNFTGAPGVFTATSNLVGNICTITAVGYIPSTASPIAQRTLQGTITSTGIASATIASAGAVSLTGNASVSNPSVSSTDSNYNGSTIDSGSTVNFTGNVSTAVSDLNPSSTSKSMKADVVQNNSALTTANLFNQFFTQTQAEIQAGATPVSKEKELNKVSGGTYYSDGDLSMSGNNSIGTAKDPTILIVNGDLSITGNTTFYGLIYVIGGTLSIKGNTSIKGAVAAEGGVSLVGNSSITFDSATVINAHDTNSNTVLHYNNDFTSLKEAIP